MKKLLSTVISLILILSCFSFCFAEDPVPFKLSGDAALVADLTTGEVLYTLNAYDQRYPASTTKMLTGILALENLDLGSTVTVDSESSGISGNTLNLKTGEKFNAKDLIYGTMIVSANDGAVALSKAVAGSVEDFVDMMNKKAEEIGCLNTHFANPNGLHDDNHYTTAYDLFLIARYCMQNETFRDIVKTVQYTVPETNMSASRTVDNTNWLLNDTEHTLYAGSVKRVPKYSGCIGIKTGATNKAGNCLIAAAEQNGTTIIAITLHAPGPYERASDAIQLLDLGFENYKTYTVHPQGEALGEIKVKRGSVKTVNAILEENVFSTVRTGNSDNKFTSELTLDEVINAPVSAGAIVGKFSVYKDGELIGEYNAVAANDVPEGGPLSVFGIDDAGAAKIFKVIKIIFIILLILAAAFAAWVFYEKEKIRRKKARKAARLKAKQERENQNKSDWLK